MGLLQKEELRALAERQSGSCVSIYMPAHRGGADARQDSIRFKNLVKRAEDKLVAAGNRPTEARTFLAPASELIGNHDFWQRQSDGLAMFLAPEVFRHYRLPMICPELVVASDRFHLKPLLRLIAGDGQYYLLALSKNQVRLLQCTRYGHRELKLPQGVPANLAEVLKFEEAGREQQGHTCAGASSVIVGYGGAAEVNKEHVRQYCQQVDHGLHPVLKDERSPLVLAAVEYAFPIYREVNTYPHLAGQAVAGNPDGLKGEELQRRAWPIVEPIFRRAQEEAAQQFSELLGTPRASDRIEDVVPASCDGRIEALFVPSEVEQWGLLNRPDHSVWLHHEWQPGDEEVFDFAAIQTFLHGGRVFAVDAGQIPMRGPVAAVYRY